MRQIETMAGYLDALRRAVLIRRTRGEAEEVCSDYRDFFRTGRKEGRSEAEICRALGPPQTLAKTLAREARSQKKSPPISGGMVARLVLTAGVLLLLVRVYQFCSMGGYGGYMEVVLVQLALSLVPALLPLALLWTWWGGYLLGGLAGGRQRLLLCHMAGVLLMAAQVAVILWSLYAYCFDAPLPLLWGEDPSQVGPRFDWEMQFAVCMAVAMLCAALAETWRKSVWYLTVAAHSVGVLLALGCMWGSMTTVASPTLDICIFVPLWAYASGLIGALAIGAILWAREKRGKGL